MTYAPSQISLTKESIAELSSLYNLFLLIHCIFLYPYMVRIMLHTGIVIMDKMVDATTSFVAKISSQPYLDAQNTGRCPRRHGSQEYTDPCHQRRQFYEQADDIQSQWHQYQTKDRIPKHFPVENRFPVRFCQDHTDDHHGKRCIAISDRSDRICDNGWWSILCQNQDQTDKTGNDTRMRHNLFQSRFPIF